MKKIITLLLFLIIMGEETFSQCYNVTNITFNPSPFTGTTIYLVDDNYSGVISIGFAFCFYGEVYNKLVIGANGVISFDTTYAGMNSDTYGSYIPTTNATRNSIMFPAVDLYPPNGGAIRYALNGASPNRTFVVSFDHISFYGCFTLKFTSQVILFESTNIIEIHIVDKPQCGTVGMTEGIQNSLCTFAATVPGRNNTIWTATNDAWRFAPSCNVCSGIGINEITGNENLISLSPNPATTELRIDDSALRINNIEIYDALGEKVYSEQQTTNNKQQTINISKLNAGIYFVKVSDGQKTAVKKVVKM